LKSNILIAFALISSCSYKPSPELQKAIEKQKLFQSEYEFDLQAFGQSLPQYCNSESKETKSKISPIIIYERLKNDKARFSYSLNRELQSSEKSLILDSINTVVLINHNEVDIGYYSDYKTKAQRIESSIQFFDVKDKKCFFESKLLGPNPPESVKKYRSIDGRHGGKPSTSSILNVIRNNINKK
jgi:hypothetical protein